MASINSVNSSSSMVSIHLDPISNQESESVLPGVEEIGAALREIALRDLPASRGLSEPELKELATSFVSHIEDLNTRREEYDQIDMRTSLEQGSKWVDFEGQRVLWLAEREVGSGSDCSVYLGITSEGVLCALKQRKSHLPEAQWNRMARFIDQLASSKNVVHTFAANSEFIVEEYLEWNLHNLLQQTERDIQNENPHALEYYNRCIDQWNEGLLQGLADIHAQGITHSDIKLENLLLGADDVIKISDFGYAVKKNKIHGGTSSYYAPEQIVFLRNSMLSGGQLVQKLKNQDRVDVWGGMLVLAKMNRQNLTKPFADRLRAYEAKQAEIAWNAQKLAKGVGKARVQSELENYAKANIQYINGMVAERKEKNQNVDGLFSDLEAKTPIERLLVQMSYFDPNKRISSAEALELYRNKESP